MALIIQELLPKMLSPSSLLTHFHPKRETGEGKIARWCTCCPGINVGRSSALKKKKKQNTHTPTHTERTEGRSTR